MSFEMSKGVNVNMFKTKKRFVLAWMLAITLSMSMLPSYVALAADDDSSISEDTQADFSGNFLTIDENTTDPAFAIKTAINEATEDITIYLTADPSDDEDKVVCSFEEPLTVPSDISISINGKDGVEYILQAACESACSDSILSTSSGYTAFINVNGSLTLDHVTIDANEYGRAVYVADTSTFTMKH